MIAYLRGRLEGPTTARKASIRTEEGALEADVYSSADTIASGAEVVVASATIAVGVADRACTALLGSWPHDRPDPGDPLGLASTPVIVLPERSGLDIALAGIERAGRATAVSCVEAWTPNVGLALLAAVRDADAIVLVEASSRHADLVRILGGRAVVALPALDPDAIRGWLRDAELGADIPVPTTDDHASAAIASLGLEAVHQLVQVDPTPAFDQAGLAIGNAPAQLVTAAAAGVLAGRIAVGNRRWRASAEP